MKSVKLSLLGLLLINILVMIVFMFGISFLCTNEIYGGECFKFYDNSMFFIQIILNIAFSAFFYLKISRQNSWKLFVNLALISIFYIIAAFFHSVLQIGLF